MKNKNKGFTLIELLVVIAIIGILSSVVLASLNSARNKGADAAIKSNLANTRAQAEINYDTNGHYGAAESTTDTCSNSGTPIVVTGGGIFTGNILAQVQAAVSASGAEAICVSSDGVTGAGGNAQQWAISVPLKSGGSWCVDSTGTSKSGTATYNGTTFTASCV
jgi:type IV pilus assembly protein PilA